MKLLGEMRTTSLPDEQIERIGEIAEEAARKSIMSRVPKRGISNLSISVELEETETVNVEVDVEIELSPLLKGINAKTLADESVTAAFEAVEEYLRETGCRSGR